MKTAPLQLDGALATYLQAKHRLASNSFDYCWEQLNISQPEWITAIHIDYLKAGANIISSNTLNANYLSLKRHGLRAQMNTINKAAILLAQQAIEDSGKTAKVAGVIGPGPYQLSKITQAHFIDSMKKAWKAQAKALISAAADYLLLETMADSENALLCTQTIFELIEKQTYKTPVILSLSLNKQGKFYSGSSLKAFCKKIIHYPLQALGLNCMPPNASTLRSLFRLSKLCQFPIIFYPNAGLSTTNGNSNVKADTFKNYLSHIQTHFSGRLYAIGGCCGTTPDYINCCNK